jgi:hypothetical protein
MVDAALFTSDQTEYITPDSICRPVIEELGLDFDAAASHENHRLPNYATIDGVWTKHFSIPTKWAPRWEGLNGLTLTWDDRRVWCNPPYGRGPDGTEAWVKKAALERGRCPVSALLLPARTETDWFQRWVFPYAEVHFLMGRISFIGHNGKCEGREPHDVHVLDSAPFPSVIAVYSPRIHIAPGDVLGRTWDPKTSAFASSIGLSKYAEIRHRPRQYVSR